MAKKSDFISKASKGSIRDFYNSSRVLMREKANLAVGLMPHFSREKALDAIRKDSTVISALSTLVDKALENGHSFRGKNAVSGEKTLKKLRFKKLLRQMFYNIFGYQNVFIENVKDGRKQVKELHILETTQTEPVADEHGDVKGYIQVIPGVKSKDLPTWKPDEVTHIAITKLTTSIWGELDLEAVYTSVLIKQYVYAYFGWLFGTNQFKGFFNIKKASEGQIKEFLSFMKATETDITKPLIAEGEIEYKLLRTFEDGDTILNLINKCDDNILTLLQVPPIAMGKPGDSNRSNSDSQESSLITRIRSIQNVCEEAFEEDLFPKIGLEGLELMFNPISKSNVSKLLEDAERMKNMGFFPEQIEKFLVMEGFPLKGKLFDPKIEETKKSDDMFQSRQGKQPGEPNKRIGTGKAGTTRADQISKGKTDYTKYPYVIEEQNAL